MGHAAVDATKTTRALQKRSVEVDRMETNVTADDESSEAVRHRHGPNG